MTHAMRPFAALLLLASLTTAGCGGGGGGGGSGSSGGGGSGPVSTDPGASPVAAPASATPLALTAANAAVVAGLAPAAGEGVLTIAQFAVDSTRPFTVPGTVSPSIATCPNGGLLTVTLIDRDGDGVASAGDRVTVEAKDCAVPVVADIVNGTMQIDLGPPTGLPAGGLHAVVSLGDGLRFGDSTATAPTSLLGSMQFDASITALQTSLHVTASTADDLRIVGTVSNGTALTESLRGVDLAKTLQFDQARAVVTLAFRYESEALAGSVVVSTPDPLRAYLDTYPEAGRVEVAGAAGSKVVISPNFASDSSQFQYALEDGGASAAGSIDWSSAVLGYLWWDGTTALNGWTSDVFPTRGFATTDFFASATLDWKTASTAAVRLQFSRPVASTTPTLHFHFQDLGSSAGDDTPNQNVAASGTVNGALVVVTAASPLRHARNYVLQVSLDDSDGSTAVTVQDSLGNHTTSTQWTGLSFTTPANLRASAVASAGVLLGEADRLTLDARASTSGRGRSSATSGRRSRARRCISTRRPRRRPPCRGQHAAGGRGSAVVRLTVADAAGDTDATDLTIASANCRVPTTCCISAAPPVTTSAAAQRCCSTARWRSSRKPRATAASMRRLSPRATATGGTQSRQPGRFTSEVGAYENAIRGSIRPNQNGIDFNGDGRGCNQAFGRFDVIELETDASGAITRLAVDFEQHCESATAPALLGSYRVHSSVPIRR